MRLLLIQARMGSSRLPGKVLQELNGKSILQHVIERLAPVIGVDEVMVATTTLPEDDAIEEFCKKHKVKYFRGSDWDVLDRFYEAAQSLPQLPSEVIRICCDNPLHHFKVLQFAIDQFMERGVDYFSNSNHEPDYLEDGFDVEIFSMHALEVAWREANLLSEREHVTPYIKNCGKFNCQWAKSNARYHYKLSVDTSEDLDLVKAIFNSFPSDMDFGMGEVVDLLERKPELLEINKNSVINAGYAKSLRDDASQERLDSGIQD